ncbi:DUF4949 domain-containing protein [Legionella waltersii]|uniref:Hemin binding protein Hbp n=1 Tax=Legionella waltersii TaxID=66969 RepID=A0A0W0ZZW3_9GAMM|nr:DUF4949 domain-containing protein [Legionella waltersii]KTD74657.1 hemin binding protein Hbp [Legionella waltersii]SNV09070.1 hemin binding protein Hbp [Legionella waltersii]
MTFKSKLTTFLSALVIAGSAMAQQEGGCPDINDIKSEGLPMVEQIGPEMYIAYNLSYYNSDAMWGFFIAPVEGDSEETALEISNEILDSMNAPGIPHEQGGDVICSYETGIPNMIAAAIKDGQQISPLKLKQVFKTIR